MSETSVTIEMVVIPRNELIELIRLEGRNVLMEVQRQMEKMASDARVSVNRAIQDNFATFALKQAEATTAALSNWRPQWSPAEVAKLVQQGAKTTARRS